MIWTNGGVIPDIEWWVWRTTLGGWEVMSAAGFILMYAPHGAA